MQQSFPRALNVAARKVLPGLAVLPLLFLVFLWSQGMLGAQPERLRLGNPAPDFSATAQDGREFRLSDYRGRPVFLNFIKDATSPSSLALLRSFSGHSAPFDRAGAKIFGIVSSGDREALQKLCAREKLAFPLLLDSGGKLAEQFGFQPHEVGTAVIGPQGTLMYRILAVEPERHAQTLVEVSRCCVDEMIQGRIQSVGQHVGEFSLPEATTGRMTPLLGQTSQKPIVVLFLSVKCPCSNSYNERLKQVWTKYSKLGVRFIAVYSNGDETAPEIAAHATQNGFDFLVVRDESGLGMAHFKASVTPEVCVLDGSHTLRYRGRPDGAREEKEATTHELPETLEALLSGKKPPKPTAAFGCAITR